MAEYKFTQTDVIVRQSDKASIPNDPRNSDRKKYEEWLDEGNTPDPADVQSESSALLEQIAEIEGTITPRRMRDAVSDDADVAAAGRAWIAVREAKIDLLRVQLKALE